MEKIADIQGTYLTRFSRGIPFRRIIRRETVPIMIIAFALSCTLLVLKAYRQNATLTQYEPSLSVLTQQHTVDTEDSWYAKTSSALYKETALVDQAAVSDKAATENYIEVLGNDYKPKPASMPSWLPSAGPGTAKTSLTNESQAILANNHQVSQYTQEPNTNSLLILTPIKNNAKHLGRYFALLDKLKYPRNQTSLAFLVSDSTDRTQQMLIESKKWYQETAPPELRFQRFDIYRQDFFYALPRKQRHLREKQQERRIMMARARNYLWTRALRDEQWVLWIDGDLEYYPPNIVNDLMAYDKDVIVPNCLVRRRNVRGRWKHSVYDRNAWQETPQSLEMISKLKESDFLVEGYKTLKTYRRYLDRFPKNETVVPLDGVGGTFTLVKSHVHRSGVGFPAWLFQHQVETEGFAKLAKAHGYGVYGLPFYYIRHVTD
ncbi:hypothetical protein LPJ78_000734 [Coemansia sp. RSA 989]|nr:Anp1-domain-containing protein [Coemansia mojavensis]KAJ1867682.1 hypothetical protein LPJ78_000734 [Coemansia sp. RSA 989]KAJ1870322.1 hypothetical protein LPJ55_004754 [Coemansia sp. RSA 990]KAJ2673846.1 hypothetical protein IWW42_001976 [Coemansia sp. RSA 1085]